LRKLCSLKVKGVICKNWPHISPAWVFDFKIFLHFYFYLHFQESLWILRKHIHSFLNRWEWTSNEKDMKLESEGGLYIYIYLEWSQPMLIIHVYSKWLTLVTFAHMLDKWLILFIYIYIYIYITLIARVN
jgi:hypothetical protein